MSPSAFTKLERYELKYHVPIDFLPALEAFLKPWCELDSASAALEDGFYWITSLYLDSPRFTFLKAGQVEMDGRFNMRIRTYGEHPEASTSWHFEIKEKACDQVKKLRGVLQGTSPALLWDETDAVLRQAKGENLVNLKRFLHRSLSYNAHPFVLTQYRRKAWFGTMEEYARVTLDTGMRWREETGFDFTVDPRDMRASDIPERFDPGCNAVLELKCPRNQIPIWMVDLVRHFNLVRSGYSKFESAGTECLRLPAPSRHLRG
ncbi:MAG: polyphosphate polymerase domain-containing protein [Fibrobacteria bacterium]|nr:polyphosphate polymerase domain-containing protein [Fibrobacteria bacterium]